MRFGSTLQMKIKIFYSNNMKNHDESSHFLIQALKQCGASAGTDTESVINRSKINEGAINKIKIARPARGKPYAENAPWLSFSVTHTGSMWICAVTGQPMPHPTQASAAPSPALGIDAEYADRRILHPEKIMQKYFSEKEKAYVQERGAASGRAPLFAVPRPPQTTAPAIDRASFIKIWTMKESYLKMLGTGITDEAKNNCLFTDPDVCFIAGETIASLENELSAAAGRRVILSLCFKREHADAPQENTEPKLEILQLH